MKKNTILFFGVFLSGVICANILGIVSGRELGAMNEYFINRYMYADIQGRELFPFLFYQRTPEFFWLLVLSIGIYGTLIADAYICYIGFSVGFLSVIAIMNYGMKGILLMMGFFLPQWFFYASVLVLWRHGLKCLKGSKKEYIPAEQKRGRNMKALIWAILAGILFLLGLFVESYVNPFFLQKVIRIIG